MKRKWMFIAPLAILGILAMVAIGGALVMVLWNWLVPPIFGWSRVTLWQALGLLALCRILFGGSGRHGFQRSRWSPEAKVRFREALHGFRGSERTPEDKERFRQAIRERWGGSASTRGNEGD